MQLQDVHVEKIRPGWEWHEKGIGCQESTSHSLSALDTSHVTRDGPN